MSTAYRDCPDRGDPCARLINAYERKRDLTLTVEEWEVELLDLDPGAFRYPLLPRKIDLELSPEEWAVVLVPVGPRERPIRPPGPGEQTTEEQRIRLMRWRISNGFRPIHPCDSWVIMVDVAGGQVLRNGRNGANYAGEAVSRG